MNLKLVSIYLWIWSLLLAFTYESEACCYNVNIYSTENSMTIGKHLRSSQLICPCRLWSQLRFVRIAVSASWTQVGGASWCNQCLARMKKMECKHYLWLQLTWKEHYLFFNNEPMYISHFSMASSNYARLHIAYYSETTPTNCVTSYPGLLTPAFVTGSTDAGEGLVKASHVQWCTWTCGGMAHSASKQVRYWSQTKTLEWLSTWH